MGLNGICSVALMSIKSQVKLTISNNYNITQLFHSSSPLKESNTLLLYMYFPPKSVFLSKAPEREMDKLTLEQLCEKTCFM